MTHFEKLGLVLVILGATLFSASLSPTTSEYMVAIGILVTLIGHAMFTLGGKQE